MSSDIPSPPIIYTLYHKFRSIVTPKQNGIYLLGESILLGILMSIFIYDYIISDLIILISLCISLAIVSLTSYLWVEKDMYHREDKMLRVTFKRLIVISFFGLIPMGLIYLITSTYNILLLIIILVYSGSLYWRSKKYNSERLIYISRHSDINEIWYTASVCMEQGIKNLENGNKYRGFYWFKQAQKKYKYINENEKRKCLRKGAKELSKSSMLFSILTFVDKLDFKMYNQEAHNSIKRANKHFATRFCDSCNKRKKIEDTTMFITEDGEQKIFCNYCQSNNYAHQQEDYKSYRDAENKNKRRKKQEQSMTVKKARNILDISDPVNKSSIKKAYRNKVKETHPDVGGSEKEFKKTEEAKEVLLSHINNVN